MILFRVYYSKHADQKIFDGHEDNIGLTPVDEVLVIVQQDKEHGRKLVSKGDYYIWDDDCMWLACDRETKDMYMRRPGMHRYLRGVMVSNAEFDEVMRKARLDLNFPEQTALHVFESREGFNGTT